VSPLTGHLITETTGTSTIEKSLESAIHSFPSKKSIPLLCKHHNPNTFLFSEHISSRWIKTQTFAYTITRLLRTEDAAADPAFSAAYKSSRPLCSFFSTPHPWISNVP
jgi:hypothetical protein